MILGVITMPLTPEQLEKIQKQSSDRKVYAAQMSHKLPFSTVYIPEQNLFVRFYTDKDGEYIRTIYRHKFEKLHGQCLGPRECKICKFINTLEEWPARWQFSSREIGIAYGFIDEYAGPESKYVKVGEPVLLMANYKLSKSLSEFIVDLGSLEEIKEFFDPTQGYFRTRLRSRDKGKDFDFGVIPTKRITVPPLPDTFPPLSECIYPEHQGPSDEVVEKFKELIMQSYLAAQTKTQSHSQSADDLPWKDDDTSSTPHPEQPDNCPTRFGQRKAGFNTICLACMVEDECHHATPPTTK
jgi:hypothetical protein